jgi:hypothetical protein
MEAKVSNTGGFGPNIYQEAGAPKVTLEAKNRIRNEFLRLATNEKLSESEKFISFIRYLDKSQGITRPSNALANALIRDENYLKERRLPFIAEGFTKILSLDKHDLMAIKNLGPRSAAVLDDIFDYILTGVESKKPGEPNQEKNSVTYQNEADTEKLNKLKEILRRNRVKDRSGRLLEELSQLLR